MILGLVRETCAQSMIVELRDPYITTHTVGIVVDPNDRPIAGATVKVMSPEWKTLVESIETDGEGIFRFKRRRQNLYYLEIHYPGFQLMHVKLKLVRRKTKIPRIRA